MQNTYKTTDIVSAIIGMRGVPIEQMLTRLETKFPGVGGLQLGEAIREAQRALVKQAASDFEEANTLRDLYDARMA